MSEETKAPTKKRIQWTTDKIMSTSALFISVISLVALLYQSYLAREENKLIQQQQSASVLPYLSQWYTYTGEKFIIRIGNKGVGPAFISDVQIKYANATTFNNSDDFFEFLFDSEKSLDSVNFDQSTLVKGYVLPANQTIDILTTKDRAGTNAFRQVMATRDINFSIKYADVYGTEWIISDASDIPVKANTAEK